MFMSSLNRTKKKAEQFHAFMDQHSINIDNKVTDEIYAKLYFVRYQYMAVILDALLYKRALSWKDLNKVIFNNLPKRIVDKVPVAMAMIILEKMFALDYIDIKESKKNYFEFTITSLGLQIAKNMSIHNLAATTFFSYQAQRTNKLLLRISVTATIIAVTSAVFTYLSLN